jgi:hypothetical protein
MRRTALLTALAGGVLGIVVGAPAQTIFTENFEGGMLGAYTETDGAGNPAATLWHGEGFCTLGTPIPAPMGTKAASYNQGDLGTYTYNTGATNSGAIQSPLMPLAPSFVALLEFDMLRESEGGLTFDQSFVESRAIGGAYATDLQVTAQSVCAITTVSVALSAQGPLVQHQFRFDSVDSVSNNYQGWTVDNVSVEKIPAPVVFTEDFEGVGLGAYAETDGSGNPAATLWHGEGSCVPGTPIPASMGTKAASYNQGDVGTYTYNTGVTNAGAIESPVIPLSSTIHRASLTFDYLKETEGGGTATFDQCFVDSKPAGGAYTTDLQVTGNSVCTRTVVNVDLSATGFGIRHQFRFNSVDSVSNNYQGWTVDNVVVSQSVDPAPTPNYCADPKPSSFSTIVGLPGTVVAFGPGNDDPSTVVPLAFPFSFYGNAKTQIEISVNGLAGFNTASIGASFANAPPGTPGGEEDILMPWWDDLHTGATGSVSYNFLPGGPLVIQWNNVQHFPNNASGENATFQLRLHPAPSNLVEFRYNQATFLSGADPWTASVGVEADPGIVALDVTGLGASNVVFPGTDFDLSYSDGGSLTTDPTGCGMLGLVAGGGTSLGATLSIGLTGVSPGGVPVMWVGSAAASPLCGGCTLGANLDILIPGVTAISGVIPCEAALLGGGFSVQGADVFSMGGCAVGMPFPVALRVSDTIDVVIG